MCQSFILALDVAVKFGGGGGMELDGLQGPFQTKPLYDSMNEAVRSTITHSNSL